VHNGYGRGNGSGKRWLLIGLLVLGGFWLVNDSYRNGFNDALVQSGQTGALRYYHGGPHFPWGLLILAGIGYIAWRKGAFDRFGGPGGPFGGGYGNGERGVDRYDGAPGAPGFGQGFGPSFRGPRGFFEEWHRQAHEAQAQAQRPGPPAPPAGAPAPGNGTPPAGFAPAPPPPPPAPEYWAAMAGAAAVPTPPTAPQPQPPQPHGDGAETPAGEAGPALDRW